MSTQQQPILNKEDQSLSSSSSSSNTPVNNPIVNKEHDDDVNDDQVLEPETYDGTAPTYTQYGQDEENHDNLSNPKSVDDDNNIANGQDELSRYESNPAVSRNLSRRQTGSENLMAEANNTDEPLPKMGGGRDYPPPLPDRTPYLVGYDGPDDPIHPHNWQLWKKISMSLIVGLSALSVSLGSAMFSESSEDIMVIFHVGATVATLGTSLFVFGFASGPIIWGPLSELFGRVTVQICSSLGYICFSFAVATAKDLQTIMICRFFAGFIGAAPLVVCPAIMADMFGASTRGQAMTVFAMVLFGGPMLAPILGGFTVKNESLGWRWTSYFCGIVGAGSLILQVFLLEETHHGLILARKAETLRRRTGNWGIMAPHEEFSLTIKEIVEKNISRPVIMLFTEPILFLVTLYNAFIYGIIYLCLTAIPFIFQQGYHFSTGVAELPYVSMLIGVFIGAGISLSFEKRFNRVMEANGGRPVPEERLPPMMVGSFLFTIGLFWVGWTGSYPEHVHWIVPTIGSAFIGLGLITIFLPCINYIIDCYLFYAASAMAGNTLLRSAFGAAFPLFARPMLINLTVKWALTLLGCISILLLPVPFLFYKFGAKIREKSKYSIEIGAL